MVPSGLPLRMGSSPSGKSATVSSLTGLTISLGFLMTPDHDHVVMSMHAVRHASHHSSICSMRMCGC